MHIRGGSGVLDATQADEFLIERIREGDQAAWREFIARFEGRLQAFARSRLTAHSDAEDVVQEAFIGFVQSLPYFDAKRSLETYLFAILRNKITDFLKKRRAGGAVQAVGADPEEDILNTIPGSVDTPSHYAADREAEARLADALADALRAYIHELRDRDKFEDLQVIELVFFVGRRNKDVGELLEVDEKHVAGVKFRAIKKVQAFIEQQGAGIDAAALERVTDLTVSALWRERRMTCLKRSTLGSYEMGILDEPWLSYAQFHLDVVGCPMCVANLEDLRAESEETEADAMREQIFASSVGFLSRAPEGN